MLVDSGLYYATFRKAKNKQKKMRLQKTRS